MPFNYFDNGIANGMIQTPNDYFRDQQQAAIDQNWDCTSAKKCIKEQKDFGLDEYCDIEVWIDYVVGMTSRGTANGDDFRKLLFRNINHEVKKGLYYKFDENTWLTYFTDKYSSLDVDIGVRRCNNVMRIKDPENGNIFSIPCVVEYDMTAPSLQVTSSVLTPNNHASIMVQGNSDTLRLFKLNTRYIFGGRPFKLLAYQNTIIDNSISSEPTLLYLDLFLDELHAEDDIVNQLADNGDYNYSINIDSNDMKLTKDSEGSLKASVSLNGKEVNREIIWTSSNNIVSINKEGFYKVLGNNGSCTITATLKGNDAVASQINIEVVESSALKPKIIIEPIFTKIRQYENIKFKIEVNYGSESLLDIESFISLNKQKQLLSNNYLVITKEDNNSYQLTCNQLSEKNQILYVTVESNLPKFKETKEFQIETVSMLG